MCVHKFDPIALHRNVDLCRIDSDQHCGNKERHMEKHVWLVLLEEVVGPRHGEIRDAAMDTRTSKDTNRNHAPRLRHAERDI